MSYVHVKFERATDAVLRAHRQGGKVLDRRSAEALVRLVIVALGGDIEVRSIESDIESPQDDGDDGEGLASDIGQP